MTIDIEKLATEHLTPFARTGWTAYGEQLKQFAEAYAAKVLEDKERENSELKTKIKHETSRKHINELQSSINVLREALEDIAKVNHSSAKCGEIASKALQATPAQSLQEHDNEVIERCAKVCEENEYSFVSAVKIRALKG